MSGLKIEPEFGAGSEVAGGAQGGVGGDVAFLIYDFTDAAYGDVQLAGEGVDADAERFHEFFAEDFAGVDGGQEFGCCGSLVVSDSRQFLPPRRWRTPGSK